VSTERKLIINNIYKQTSQVSLQNAYSEQLPGWPNFQNAAAIAVRPNLSFFSRFIFLQFSIMENIKYIKAITGKLHYIEPQ